jgi:hypothetical protein
MDQPRLSIVTWLWGDYPIAGLPQLVRRCAECFPAHEFAVLTQPGRTEALRLLVEAELPPLFRVHVFEIALGNLWVMPDPARSLVSISFPPCYVRLYLWSQEFATLLRTRGLPTRVLQLDLDSVPVGGCRDMVAAPRVEAEPVVLMDGHCRVTGDAGYSRYSGAQLLISAGDVPDLWERFSREIGARGRPGNTLPGSDQQLISQYLGPGRPVWSAAAGIWRARELPRSGIMRSSKLPEGVRMVHFSAHAQPWTRKAQAVHPWLAHV